MDELRITISTAIFSLSCYLVYDLFANGFNWIVLLFCIGGYILVHFIWPRKTSGDNDWLDLLEFVVDLPYCSIALLIRSIGRISRGSGDVDIDV